eukprot:gnl/Hemi2/26658_TR8947_c0_g3_i1.p1 gnl/Hemi2/26658_TR8947_c0_g3~~gnl/Hemi2/26658_TR8947_c0_g3_i1.p1  ORF type:complete len:210 (+),score=38.43 gnl/Hemi2/26658_TR8947_c0_g3_i1:55-630(+)
MSKRSRSRSRSPHRDRDRDRDRSRSRSRSRSRERSENSTGTNIYVSGLSVRTTEEDLERRFTKFGNVSKCELVYDPRTHESRGFGFVTMSIADEADEAIRSLHKTDIDGRIATVEKAKRSGAREPTPGRYLGSDRAIRDRLYNRSRGYGGDRGGDRGRYSPPHRRGRSDSRSPPPRRRSRSRSSSPQRRRY